MDKRLLILGIVLIIIGLLVAGSSYSSNNYVNTSSQAISVAPNSVIYSSISLNATGLFELVYSSGNVPIDFYILNGSAFDYIGHYLNSSIPKNATASLRGKGLIFEAHNSTKAVYPYNSSYSSLGLTAPSYYYSGNSLPQGKYYLVYSNPSNTYANVTYEYVLPNAQLFNPNSSFYSSLSSASIASSVLFLAGIIIAVLSFFRKSKPKEDPMAREAVIAGLYEKMEAKHKARTTGKARKSGRKRKRARRRR